MPAPAPQKAAAAAPQKAAAAAPQKAAAAAPQKAAAPASKVSSASSPALALISEEQRKELRQIFDVIDDDKNGSVSIRCLLRILRSFEVHISDDQVFDTCKIMGLNGPSIRIDDLCLAVGGLTGLFNPLKVPFMFFDKNNEGFIAVADLKKAVEKSTRPVTDEQLKTFTETKVKDGKVAYSDFCSLCGIPLVDPVTKLFTHHVYLARFGDVCGVCQRLVTCDNPTIVEQVYYHPACYACAGCDKVLTDKDKIKKYQSRPLCQNCKRPAVSFT